MTTADADYAAMIRRLPVLRRYEWPVRTKLHQLAMRRPGARGDTLDRIVWYFTDSVQSAGPVDRAFLKRVVAFADYVMDGMSPDEAVRIACRLHPDPYANVP